MINMFSIAKAILSPAIDVVSEWQKRKTVKLEGDIAIAEAKTNAHIEKIKTGQEADIAWEKTALDNSGLKDEYWTIVLSIPMIMCFIPGLAHYVHDGFAALQTTPEWYRYSVGVAIASAFGVKQVSSFMKLKRGS